MRSSLKIEVGVVSLSLPLHVGALQEFGGVSLKAAAAQVRSGSAPGPSPRPNLGFPSLRLFPKLRLSRLLLADDDRCRNLPTIEPPL